MRNIEPPFGRGSALKRLEILARRGAIAVMNSLIGACTLSRKRGLLASNQGRSLCAFSSRKKAKKSFGKPLNPSVISVPLSMALPHASFRQDRGVFGHDRVQGQKPIWSGSEDRLADVGRPCREQCA